MRLRAEKRDYPLGSRAAFTLKHACSMRDTRAARAIKFAFTFSIWWDGNLQKLSFRDKPTVHFSFQSDSFCVRFDFFMANLWFYSRTSPA
jgi:hypothetical protein